MPYDPVRDAVVESPTRPFADESGGPSADPGPGPGPDPDPPRASGSKSPSPPPSSRRSGSFALSDILNAKDIDPLRSPVAAFRDPFPPAAVARDARAPSGHSTTSARDAQEGRLSSRHSRASISTIADVLNGPGGEARQAVAADRRSRTMSASTVSSSPSTLARDGTAERQPPPSASKPVAFYRPRRVTPARSVMVPIQPDELARLQASVSNPLRTSTPGKDRAGATAAAAATSPTRSLGSQERSAAGQPSPTTLGKRAVEEEEKWDGLVSADDGRRQKRRVNGAFTGDVVADHYNLRPEVGLQRRFDSPIIGLKNFNNWIKSVLIGKFARHLDWHAGKGAAGEENGLGRRDGAPGPPPPDRRHSWAAGRPVGGRVLDIGCGKGGDLMKWSKAQIDEYIGIDLAEVSVQQAESRYQQMRTPKFRARFRALDCYSNPISSVIASEILQPGFDNVSMQFCMHYAFESASKVRMMLENVSRHLRPGGVFLGTIPNADTMLSRLRSLPADELSYGNSVYRISFDTKAKFPAFGHRYNFFLQDAVEDVPEFVVQWSVFEDLALEYGLHLIYRKEFHEIFAEERYTPDFGPLLERMKVVLPDGTSQMTEEQWEAANIYIGFAFEKR